MRSSFSPLLPPLFASLVLCFALAGCGSGSSESGASGSAGNAGNASNAGSSGTSGAAGSGGAGASGGSGGSAGTGGSNAGPCPTTMPKDGDACPTPNLVCETEDGPVLVCRARLTCTMNGWLSTAPGCSSTPDEDPKCPASPPMGTCDAMTDPDLCTIGDQLCGCSNCLGGPCGGQGSWVCATPPAAGCPATAPKLGAPCAMDMLDCEYGACPLGGTARGRVCLGGIWTEQIAACPQ